MATTAARRLDPGASIWCLGRRTLAAIWWGNNRGAREIGNRSAGAGKSARERGPSAREQGPRAQASGDGERARLGKDAERRRKDSERGWIAIHLLYLLDGVFSFFFLF
jgi:hypothetical protein